MLKGQKGVTLIALVVTIVVLIILAAVSIQMTISQNGIFSQAQQAAKDTKNAETYSNEALANMTQTINQLVANAQS